MTDSLKYFFTPFAAAEDMTVEQIAELVKQYPPNYPEAKPAWRAIGAFCNVHRGSTIEMIAAQMGRTKTSPANINYVQRFLRK